MRQGKGLSGVVSKRKEDLWSSLICPLTLREDVVFVWERCRFTVVVVCMCARVSICGYKTIPLLKCRQSRCYLKLKPRLMKSW